MSMFVPEVQTQARAASLLLVQRVREYFTDLKNCGLNVN